MGKRFSQLDLSQIGDDKALAIAAYGESVAAYRYIVLAEKAPGTDLRDAFESMSVAERQQRDRLQALLQKLSPTGAFYLSPEDKLAVCVGPRLVDARDDARFDEALRLVIASEKRTASFYHRYAKIAHDPAVAALFDEFWTAGITQIRQLRAILKRAGREIAEACPVGQLRM
jgi:rubrerythrin